LRILARQIKVKTRRHIEYSDWGDILRELNKKVAALKNASRSPQRQATVEFYSNMADRCEYMNHLWRREVSHARKGKVWEDADALGALNKAREFMGILAQRRRQAK